MTTLIIDGMNFMHRARSGFQAGDYHVVYNFVRNLKAIVERFGPDRVVLTLEGHPHHRFALLPEYKANRAIDQTTEEGAAKHRSLLDFFRQVDAIVGLLQHLPVSVMQQRDHEADDLIHNVVKNASTAGDFIVVSSDSDFIQLLQRFSNVRLYNPIKKAFVESPDHDYVFWKALRGDASDNVPAYRAWTTPGPTS